MSVATDERPPMLGAGAICLLIGLEAGLIYGIWQAFLAAALVGVTIIAGNMIVMATADDSNAERLFSRFRRVKWVVGVSAFVIIPLLGAEMVSFGPGA
jgi:hypothetical protein